MEKNKVSPVSTGKNTKKKTTSTFNRGMINPPKGYKEKSVLPNSNFRIIIR